jgi:hypothetical protein
VYFIPMTGQMMKAPAPGAAVPATPAAAPARAP